MTDEQLSNTLGALVRDTGGDGLSTPDYIAKMRPDLEWTPQVVGVVTALGRSPFPSIQGPFPVDKDRPFLDLRRINGTHS